jgi:hypothetical protein
MVVFFTKMEAKGSVSPFVFFMIPEIVALNEVSVMQQNISNR